MALEVYNQQGETILTLLKEKKTAGKYSITLPVSELPSGVYICRLSTATDIHTRMFVIIQ
jgi:hypothetical protein